MQILSERLSSALESARLYEETRRRAERERLTGEITARVRASNDPQVILQTAVKELRRALQADRAQLLVHRSTALESSATVKSGTDRSEADSQVSRSQPAPGSPAPTGEIEQDGDL